jgi:16S rRNA (cytidine1402-2'-O)-methyltransferase
VELVRSLRYALPACRPSSILLAMMASGMNGQSFTFHGYLPKKGKKVVLKNLEKISGKNQSQILLKLLPKQ